MLFLIGACGPHAARGRAEAVRLCETNTARRETPTATGARKAITHSSCSRIPLHGSLGWKSCEADSALMGVTAHGQVLSFELNLWRTQMPRKGRESQEPLAPQLVPCWSSPPPPQATMARSVSCFHCPHSVRWLLVTLELSSWKYFNEIIAMSSTMPGSQVTASHSFSSVCKG